MGHYRPTYWPTSGPQQWRDAVFYEMSAWKVARIEVSDWGLCQRRSELTLKGSEAWMNGIVANLFHANGSNITWECVMTKFRNVVRSRRANNYNIDTPDDEGWGFASNPDSGDCCNCFIGGFLVQTSMIEVAVITITVSGWVWLWTKSYVRIEAEIMWGSPTITRV